MAEETDGAARVLVVEDHAALGEALLFAFSFEAGVEVVGLAPTVAAAVEMVASSRPDVVLMDVRLPDGNGIEATSRVLEVHPGAAVVVLTAHADPLFALRAADAGAAGFVPKDVRIARIVAAVRAVRAGEVAVEPTVLRSLLAQGVGSEGIAGKLGLDAGDVEPRVAATLEGLGARSRLEALVLAARRGLLQLGSG